MIEETPKTKIDNFNAKKYVAGAYPFPSGFGILNTNKTETKYDNIAIINGIII